MKLPAFLTRPVSSLAGFLITSGVVLLVLGYAGGCFLPRPQEALPEGYPTREVIDTRQFDNVLLNDSLKLVIHSAYFAALPNEMGLCIYGYYYDGTIFVTGLRADSTISAAGYVNIFCTEEEEDDPVIGDVHSHPLATNPAFPCVASRQDYFSLLIDNHAVSVIYCGNGSGVIIFRDGRWWDFAWR